MASKFTITAELNLQTKNLGQVVNNLKRQFQGVDLNIKIKDMAKAESQLRNVSNEAKSASQSIGILGSSIGTAFKRFTAVTLATGTIVGFTRAIKNAVGDAIEFEREVVKIAQATGKTTDQLKGLTSEISSVASNFGVSSKELILAARSLTQAGFAADKVTGALKLLAQTELAATFDSIGDTTEGIIALLNQFGQAAQKSGNEIGFLEKSLSAINQVSKDFAVESSDLITAIRTTGSAFESAGGNLNELLALFTSVRSTTRESAESIATGFRTIFTRVQRLDTINNLRALGVELQDVEGKFIGPMEATKRLSIVLNSIDPKDFRFNMIVEELGGFRQVSKVIPLIQQFATTQKALNVAQGASGSLAKDAATAQQALAVQISKTREKFSTFIRDMSESSSFQGTVKTLLSMAEAFLRVADTIKPLIPLLASFAAFKIGSAILPGLKSLGSNKKAEGGVIRKFARGGLVPGQGNGDTVPAMLTPGEFVIKKSSVNKLGVDNLARANKYGHGGSVQYYGKSGQVKNNDISKQETLKPSADKHFAHLDRLSRHGGKKIYSNLGIDLPANWNMDWNKQKNSQGQSSSDLANYISRNQIFNTLLGKRISPYGFRDKKAKEVLEVNSAKVKKEFASKIRSKQDTFFDTDTDVIKAGIGNDLINSFPEEYRSLMEMNLKDIVAIEKRGRGAASGKKYKTRVRLADPLSNINYSTKAKSGAKKLASLQGYNTGGFVKLHPDAGSRKSKYEGIDVNENMWDASFDVSDPRAFDYFVRAIHESTAQKTNLEKYAKSKGKNYKEMYNLLQGQNADWFEDRIHDEIGGTLAGGNYYVDIIGANKTVMGDVDVKDTKKRESSSEFGAKAYKHAVWKFTHGLGPDPKTLKNVDISSVTTHTNDPVFKKSLKQKIAELTSSAPSKQTVEEMAKLGLSRPTMKDVDNVITTATFKTRATEFQGKKLGVLSNMPSVGEDTAQAVAETGNKATQKGGGILASVLYNKLIQKYKDEGDKTKIDVGAADAVSLLKDRNLSPIFSAILGAKIGKNSILTDQQAAIIKKSLVDRIGFATGGAASGTDTVPAMLTPGEFVINKKSAQAIGYGSLNRMNKVAKFAQGGVVQGFATGGEVDKKFLQKTGYQGGSMGPMSPAQKAYDAELVKAAKYIKLMGNAQLETSEVYKSLVAQAKSQGAAFKLTNQQVKEYGDAIKTAKKIQQLQKSSVNAQSAIDNRDPNKYKDMFKNAIDNSKQLSQNFVLVSGTITSVIGQMSGLDKATGDAITAFSTTFTAFYTIGQEFIDIAQDIVISQQAKRLESASMKAHRSVIDSNKAAIQKHTAAINQATNSLLKIKDPEKDITDNGKEQALVEKRAARLQKVMEVLNGGLVGFSVALAAGNAAIAYLSAKAQESADILAKSVEKFKESTDSLVTGDRLGAEFKKAFLESGMVDALNKGVNSTSGYQTIGASALGGAAVGSILGPIGAMLGGAIGGGAGLWKVVTESNEKFAQQQDSITKVASSMSSALYTSVTALQKFNKFILDIEKKSTGDVQKQAVSLTDAYASSTKDLINAQVGLIRTYGGLAKAPELFKQYLDGLGTSISELNKAIDTVVGNLLSRTAKEIEGIVSGGGDPAKAQEEALKKFQEVSTNRNDVSVDATYIPKIEEQARAKARLEIFNTPGGDINDANAVDKKAQEIAARDRKMLTPKLNQLKATKNEVDTLGFQKSLKEIELQSLQSTKIMRQERDARNAVVGSLIKELALTVALQNFNHSLEKINSTISNINAAFSGMVSGLRSSIPDIRVLDLLKPTGKNLKDFNIALNRIRSIDTAGGPGIGNGIADSLNDVRKAAIGLEVALTDAGDKLQNMDPKQVENFVGKLLGGNASGVVGKTLQKILNDAIKPSEGQVAAGRGVGTEEGRQKVIDQFKKFAEDLSEKGKSILKALSDAEKQQQEIYNQINESRKKQLDLQLEDVDSYERYISAVARARGRDLTLGEKNSLRMEKQFRMVGGLAGNVDGIGKTLLAARRGLLESTDPAQQARYADTANRTEQALKALANQAERTSDTLAEIEKIKAQRENVRDLAKEFAIGTKEERANLQKDLQGAMSVAKSGSFESLPEDQRKGASAILERFKDLPIFNGMTGRQAQNKAIAGSVRAAGGNEEIARMIEQDTSTPEEKLINELRSIYQQEAKAKEYLYKQENVMQTALIQALHENAMETARLSQSLASEFTNMQNQQALGGKAPTEAELNARIAAVQGQLVTLTTNLDAANKKLSIIITDINNQLSTLNLTPLQEAIGFISASINKMKGAFDSLVTWIETMTGRKLVGEAAPKAKGGIIFRSKGGDTSAGINWQPKGTDTVPAMLTEGEFVVNAKDTKKHRGLLEKINSGNYASTGGVIYRESGGIAANYGSRPPIQEVAPTVKAQKPDFSKPPWIDMPSTSATDAAKFDAARRYAIAKKSELEDAHNKSPWSNIYSFDQTPLYRESINIPFSTGKNSFVSLADLLKGNFKSITEMSQDASTKPVDVTGIGKGAKGGTDTLKREDLDKKEADKLSYIFEAQGPITSFSAGLARGMMGVPFASLIEFYLNSSRSLTKMAGINSLDDFMSAAGNERVPLLNQPFGAALKSLRNANLYDSIIGRLAPTLAGATSDENSPYAGAHSWGKDLGEIMNIGEWATGAGPITSVGKLFKIGSKYPKLAKVLKLTGFGKKGLEYAGKAITAPLQGMLYFPINTILNKIIKNKKAQQVAQKVATGGGNKVSSVIENITEVALRESGEKAGTLGVDIPKLQSMIAEFVKRGDLEKVVTPEGVVSTFLKGFNPKTGFGKYKIAQVLLLARRKKQEQDKPKVEDKKPPEPPKVNGAGGGAGGGAGAGAGAGPDTNRVGGGLSITEWMGQEQPNENENIPGGMTLEEYQQYQQDLARRQAERDAYDEAKKKQQPRKGGGSYSPSYEHDWKFVNPATVNPDGSDVGPNMDGDGMGGRGDGGNGGVIGGGGRGGNGGGGAGGMGGVNENPNANANNNRGGGGGGGFEQPIIYSPYRSGRSKMQAKVIDRMVRRGELNEDQGWIAKFGRFYYTPYETASAKGGAYWKLWSDIQKAGESKGIPKDMPANYKLYYNKGGSVPSYFSDGGSVGGSQTISKHDDPGVDWTPKGSDKIRAMLSEGEFVVNADATKKNRGLLEQINSGKVDQTKKASRGGVIYRESGGIAANYSSKPVTGTPLSDYIPESFSDFVQGFLAARSGGLGAASNDTLEAIRSAGIGLGDSTRWIGDIPAMAADLTARQFGVEGNYAGQVVDSLVKGMFGSNPQNQSGHIFGKAVGYGLQGMAGAATKGAAAKGFIFEAGTSAVSDSLRAGQYDKLANIFDLGLMGYNAKNLYSNIQHIRDYGKKYELPSESISDPKLWKKILNTEAYSSTDDMATDANHIAKMLGYNIKYFPDSYEYRTAKDLQGSLSYYQDVLTNNKFPLDNKVPTPDEIDALKRMSVNSEAQLNRLYLDNPGLEDSISDSVSLGFHEKENVRGEFSGTINEGNKDATITLNPEKPYRQGETLVHEVVHSLIQSVREDLGHLKVTQQMENVVDTPTGKTMLKLLDLQGGYGTKEIMDMPGYYGDRGLNLEEYFTSTIMQMLKDREAVPTLQKFFPSFYKMLAKIRPDLRLNEYKNNFQNFIDKQAGPQAIDFLKKNNPANKAPGSEFKFDPFGDTPPPLPFDPYGSTPPPLPPQKKSMGGVIYRSKGGDATMQGINWQPKGTDTIPAMLTEGEFVVNAKQTKKNRGLLEKINSGNYASMGGVIYRAGGGDTDWSGADSGVVEDVLPPGEAARQRAEAERLSAEYEAKVQMEAATNLASINQGIQNRTYTPELTPETDPNSPTYSARAARLAQEAYQRRMEKVSGVTPETRAATQDTYDAQMARQAEYDKQQEAIRQKAEQEKAARENEQFDLALEGYNTPEERQADVQAQQDNKAKSDAVTDYSKKLEEHNQKSWLERQVSSAPIDPREHKTDNGTSWADRYVQARTGQLATQQTNEGTTTDKVIEGVRSFTGQFSNSFASAVSPAVGAVTTTLGLTDTVAGTNTLDNVNNFIGGSGFQNKTAAAAGGLSGAVAGSIVGKNPSGAATGAVSLTDDVAKPIIGAGVEWAKREGLARGSEALRDSGYNTGADILDAVQIGRAAKQTVQTGSAAVQQGRAALTPKPKVTPPPAATAAPTPPAAAAAPTPPRTAATKPKGSVLPKLDSALDMSKFNTQPSAKPVAPRTATTGVRPNTTPPPLAGSGMRPSSTPRKPLRSDAEQRARDERSSNLRDRYNQRFKEENARTDQAKRDTRDRKARVATRFEEKKAQQARDAAQANQKTQEKAGFREEVRGAYEENFGKNPRKGVAKYKEQEVAKAKQEKADQAEREKNLAELRAKRQREQDRLNEEKRQREYNDSPQGIRESQKREAERQKTQKLYAEERATRVSPTGDIDLQDAGFPDIRMPHYMALPKRKSHGGIVQHFATGGLAKGKDTIPAMLAKGEFVMQKSAVDKQGVGTMQAINNGLVAASPFMGASPTPVTGNAMPSSQPLQTASKPNKDTGDSFSSLNSIVKELTKNMQSLNDSIKNRNKKDSGWSKTTTALGFATGGSVFKPKGTDTVPAMLSQGEYVIQKKAVDSIGTETLEAINRGHGGFIGKANYLARGGLPDDQMNALSGKNPISDIRLPGAIMANNNPAAKDKTSEGFALSRPGGSGIFGNNDSNLLGMNGGAYDSSFNAPQQMQGMQPNIKTGVVSYEDMLMNMANMKLATGDNSFTSMGPVLNYSSDYMSPMDLYNSSLGAQHNALMADTQAANSSAYDRMDQAYQNNRSRAFGGGGGGGRGRRPYRPSRKDRMTAAQQGMKLGPNWRPGGQKPGFFSFGGLVSYLAKGGLPDDQLKRLSEKNPISNIGLPGAIFNQKNTTEDTGSYGPNMGTSKSESTAYDFGMGIGPMGGGGLSLNDAYLDKNSPFSPLNANAFEQNQPNIKTGVVSYEDMLMNMANMKLATGDNSFTSMGPVLNYSSDYMSPMDLYNSSLGAQHNALMADTEAANSSAYDRMDQAYQNNRSRAFGGGGGGGGGGGRGGRRRRRGRGRNMGMVGDFKAPNPNVMMASTGGFVSYLAKGGKPDDFMSGMYGVGGLSDVNSMIPTTPEAVKPMSDAFTNMPQMGQQPNLKTGVVSYEDMLMNMANMKLATGDNSFTSMGPVLNYSSDYMSPMDLYNSSLGAQHNALMADTEAANSSAYDRMDQAYQNNRSRAFGSGGGGGRRRRRGRGLGMVGDFKTPNPREMMAGGPRVMMASGGGSVSYLAKGGSSEDTVPAMLTPGEFVMSKESVGKHGMAFMNHLNKGGTIKGYASGGSVGEPIYRAAGGPASGGGDSTVNLNVDIGSISNAISSSIQRAFGSIGSIINLDSLNSLAATFSNLVQTLNGVAASVGNMNMTHQVNIGGEVNVNGINAKNIAENIKMEVGNMIVQTVKDVLNRASNNTSKRDTEAI